MRSMKGSWGSYLDVDLTAGATRAVAISGQLLTQYIGGAALGARLLYDLVPKGTPPLEPQSPLLLVAGPFQGTSFPGCAKFVAVGRSPLTGTIMVSAAGASFGPRLKRAGFDAIALRGKAASPVNLFVEDGKAELCEADSLWGLDTFSTHEQLSKRPSSSPWSTLCIGPAGERLVSLACLSVDGHSYAGRGGLGAVMGSKLLKAVAVCGHQTPPIYDPSSLRELTREKAIQLSQATRDGYKQHGTALDVAFCESVGDLPIKYWTGASWEEGAKRIGAPRYTQQLAARSNPCFACPIGCHRTISRTVVSSVLDRVPGPEYESLGMLGSACLIDDLDAIALANDRCNRLGLDAVSAGSAVAFAMECNERGLLDGLDKEGLDLAWGDAASSLAMIEGIAYRRGFGALFSDGIRAAASRIGPTAIALPVEVKGIDFPAHDPRAYFSLALNYATSPQGASHLRGFPHVGEIGMLLPEAGYTELTAKHTMEGKAELTILFQDLACLLDSLVDCCFMQISGLSLTATVEVFHAITGWEGAPADLLKVGERANVLQRLLSIEDGIGPSEDRLPARVFEPATHGPRCGVVPRGFSQALMRYYELRGYTPDGRPSIETLERLGIADRNAL